MATAESSIGDASVQPDLFVLTDESATGNGAGLEAVERFAEDPAEDSECLVRTVESSDDRSFESLIPKCAADFLTGEDLAADYDASWLRASFIPNPDQVRESVRIVDLFSGCGGMTLGAWEAARALNLEAEPVLAVDRDPEALDVYADNFRDVVTDDTPVEDLVGLGQDGSVTAEQREWAEEVGDVSLLLGGPPCQGHSNLNNHSRREDPKNALFFTMARAARLLDPEHVIIENVRDIVHDRDDVFGATRNFLESELDYSVDAAVLEAEAFGLPQRRHRQFLVASKSREVSLRRMVAPFRTRKRTFHWACGDLEGDTGASGFDTTSRPQKRTRERMKWLFDNEAYDLPDSERPECHKEKQHSYPSVYGRLRADEPVPTITTGFTCMGQGRYVHPDEPRTLTPHEAARLQGLPDWFEFGERSRNAYKRLIGNAVPPKLTYMIALQLLR